MAAVEESVRMEVPEHAAAAVETHAEAADAPEASPAAVERAESSPAAAVPPPATASEEPPSAPAGAEEPHVVIPAEVHIHAPYQVDPVTPRHATNTNTNGHLINGTPAKAAANGNQLNGTYTNGSASPAPATKIKGRPSQAPFRDPRAARQREGLARSNSAGVLQRAPHRRHLPPGYGPGMYVPIRRPPTVYSNGDSAAPPAAKVTVQQPSQQQQQQVSQQPQQTQVRASNLLHRRPRFMDPTASTSAAAVAAPETGDAGFVSQPSLEEQQQRGTPRQRRAPRFSASPLSSTMPPTNPSSAAAAASASLGASHAALYMHPVSQRQATRTPARTTVSASGLTMDSAALQPPHRRRLAGTTVSPPPQAPAAPSTEESASPAAGATNQYANVTAAAVPALRPSSLAQTLPPPSSSSSAAPTTPKSQPPTAAPAAANASDVDGERAEPAVRETPSQPSTVAPTPTTISPAARPRREPVVAEPAIYAPQQDKHVVHSRPSNNPYALRMSELTRPSEAYKLSLHPAHQRSALARRSRQPRKVLNVFLTKYPVIRKLADELGYEMETTEEELNEYKFNMCWSDTVLSLMRLVRLSNWQRTNHFPSMYLLCRKGHLGTTLGKLRHKLPSHFAFYPRTWSMRTERLQFTQYMTAVRQRRILKYFIMKPNSGCQGRGIIVARDPLTALEDHALENYIVQEYVHRPLLLEGKKFDLRVYVLLTSIRHPSVFLFNDGLVRICTEAYETPTEENVKNACKHLTNYAVNKKSTDYVFNTDVEHMDVGNKRNFGFLNRWLEETGHSSSEFWDQVGFIIVKTILAAQPSIAKVYDSCFPTGFNDGYCCFEVLGFDILIDQKMKPWLMEVNHTPSFATETPLDMDIKSKLLTEVWSIIDCKATDYEKDRQRERDEFTKRNMPPWTANHPVYGSNLSQSVMRQQQQAQQADDAESPVDPTSPVTGLNNSNDQPEMPSYVHTRRQHEDTKLHNFKRIYPSANPDVQVVYDTIQNLAIAESANNRLYYNSNVVAPPPPSSPSSPFPVRSNNAVGSRVRPPQLGPVLPSSSRAFSSSGSPNTSMPPRSLTTPLTPAQSSAQPLPNGAPASIPVSLVPSLVVARDVHYAPRDSSAGQTPSPTASPSATSPHTSSSAMSRAAAEAAVPAIKVGTLVPAVTMSNASTSRNSISNSEVAPAAAAAPPLSSAALSAEGSSSRANSTNNTNNEAPSTPTAAKPAQPVRVYTPRVSSPVTGSRAATPASTPAANAKAAQSTSTTVNISAESTTPAAPSSTPGAAAASAKAGDGAAAPAVKPKVAEVHRRVSSRPAAAGTTSALVLPDGSTKEAGTPAAPATPAPEPPTESAPQQKTGAAAATTATTATPLRTEKRPDALAATTGRITHAHHQPSGAATPPTGADQHKTHAGGPVIRITRTTAGRQKSPSLEVPSLNASTNAAHGHSQHHQRHGSADLSASTKRKSLSQSGSVREAALAPEPVIAHPRQKSGGDYDHHHHHLSMSTHPEPTEEELARLVALQAQLDYEAAADPQPDDDEDYNLTE